MKTFTMTNLLLLASITLFTACSNKTVEPEKQSVKVSIEELPMARTYPMPEPIVRDYVQNRTVSYYPNRTYRQRDYVRTPPPIVRHAHAPVPYQRDIARVINKIEWDAKKLLGKKYVWGATGPRTYDCSGFTQKIYRDAGIRIPRVSRDQARVGQYVSFNQLRKGDLMFFDTHKKRTGKVTHVGIYLGNGNFIHASSGAKKIVIFNINEKPFYKKRFLWARRVVKPNAYLAMR